VLPFERAPVQSASFELACQLASFLRQGAGCPGFTVGLQAFELLRQRALASGKLAHPLHDGLAAEPIIGNKPCAARSFLLVLCHARELAPALPGNPSPIAPGDPLAPFARGRARSR